MGKRGLSVAPYGNVKIDKDLNRAIRRIKRATTPPKPGKTNK